MIDYNSVTLKPEDTISKAINVLNTELSQIILVANSENVLLGTVTDGDIRRALINNYDLNSLVGDIMFTEPTVASVGDNRKSILSIMRNKEILQVPIVDSDRKIVGLETLQNALNIQRHENPILLMAGGFGTRLNNLTDERPKPLLKVGKKPILETIIHQFIDAGFCNFYISVHYKADMISQYFGNGSQWGVNIEYIRENTPLGTAGALGLFPFDSQGLPLIVMNGDILTKVDFESLLKFHKEQGGVATMCVREYDFQVPYGVVNTVKNRITSIVEKPIHKYFVNAGIYVLNSPIVKKIAANTRIDMPSLLEKQINAKRQVNMFLIHEYWLDIGELENFQRGQKDSKRLFE